MAVINGAAIVFGPVGQYGVRSRVYPHWVASGHSLSFLLKCTKHLGHFQGCPRVVGMKVDQVLCGDFCSKTFNAAKTYADIAVPVALHVSQHALRAALDGQKVIQQEWG